MKIVILGCGRVGAMLAVMMADQDHDVTVIDQNSEAFERLGHHYKGEIKTVVGDGIDEDVLRSAGIEDADAFCAVTNGDNRNIMAAQIASHTFQVKKVICRIYDPIRQETYKKLGLESICPTVIGAKLLRDIMLKPAQDATATTAQTGPAPAGGARPTRPASTEAGALDTPGTGSASTPPPESEREPRSAEPSQAR